MPNGDQVRLALGVGFLGAFTMLPCSSSKPTR